MNYLLEILLSIVVGLLGIAQLRSRTHYATQIAEQKRQTDEQNNSHALQIQSLQSESGQQKAQLEIIKELATGIPKNQETWQSVLNNMSARRLEGDKEIAGGLRELALTNRDNTKAIDGIAGIIEINTTAYGTLRTKVEESMTTFVQAASATHKAVDSQSQGLALVQLALETLTTRIDDLIDIKGSNIEAQGKRHNELKKASAEQKLELTAINTTLKTALALLERTLLHAENTQPIPEVKWNEDVEDTVNMLPDKHETGENPLIKDG